MSAGVHPQVTALLEAQAVSGLAAGPADLAALRAGYLQTALALGGARETVESVQDLVIDGHVPARAYEPSVTAADPGVLLWIHGGGWIMGDLEGFDHVCRSMANAAGHHVVSVAYRLAPEHPFPAGLDDVRAAVRWAAGHGAEQLGYDPARVAIGGDSAGGNLATVAVRHLRELVRAQVLVYPVTDAAMDTPSYREFADDENLNADAMANAYAAYLDGHDADDADASPLRAATGGGLVGVPPTLIAVAGHDVLRDDGLRYADALRAAGAEVEVTVYEDMVHGFLRWGGAVDRAGELVREVGGFVRARLA